MSNLSFLQTSTGFDARTLIHTAGGLRAISTLKIGDLVLVPDASGKQYESKPVVNLEIVDNAPIVKADFSFFKAGASFREREALYLAGMPYLLVSGLDPDITSDPEYPQHWLIHLNNKIGWQTMNRVERGLRLYSMSDPSAYIWHVDQVWKTSVPLVGWVGPNRDSGEGYKIEFSGDQIIEHTEAESCQDLAKGVFEDESAVWDRHDVADIAQTLAMRNTVFSIALQDNSPFFVGQHGLLVQPGATFQFSEGWAHERIWED